MARSALGLHFCGHISPGALWLSRMTVASKAIRQMPALVRRTGKLSLMRPGSAGHHQFCLLVQLCISAVFLDVLGQGCKYLERLLQTICLHHVALMPALVVEQVCHWGCAGLLQPFSSC